MSPCWFAVLSKFQTRGSDIMQHKNVYNGKKQLVRISSKKNKFEFKPLDINQTCKIRQQKYHNKHRTERARIIFCSANYNLASVK